MKLTEKWLREWVNPSVDSETLAEQLTMAGLEVDDRQAVAADFSHVVVGKVVQCEPHPNADKLRVTKVDIGAPDLLTIVCGAPNCRLNLLVAVATNGAELPGGLVIKPTTLRGVDSQGMLCSWRELGIMEDHQGIIELAEDAPVGQDFRDYLQLDDYSLDISLTPNRADCLSIRGIARDIAAVNQMPLQEVLLPAVPTVLQDTLPVKVSAEQACPNYLTRIIRDVNLQAKTPLWLQERLRRCGIRSIDPVVDITNYVMLELGQPLHAFDLDKIQHGITVRLANANESLTLLDGNTITLTDDVLVIADDQKALAMAGVFGGVESAVSEQTQHIVLESAYFQPAAIRGRARRYGLHTDASHRFERGVDPQLQQPALERATALIIAICGGNVAPIAGVVNEKGERPTITLRPARLQQLLGHLIAEQTVTDILQSLGCQLTPIGQGWQVSVPSWRFDLTIEEDLIEEVARIYGYNQIPHGRLAIELLIPHYQETQLSLKRVKTLLADRDYQEAITYSFVDPKLQTMLHPQQPMLQLPNPISVEMSAMRLSLWSGLLTAVMHNQRRQQSRVRLFEHGLRFIVDEQAPLGVRQEEMLAAVITGDRYQEQWDVQNGNVDFYDLKADLSAILQLTGEPEQYRWRTASHPALHPGQTAAIEYHGQVIGYLGVLHPMWEKKLGLQGNTVLFELCWSKIAAGQLPQAQLVSRYPANRRDIAVIVADEIMADDILNACKKVGGNQLVGVNLFDVYRGNGVQEGYKSLAISLLLQDNSRTLEEEEITSIVGKCISALQQQFQASLRD